MGGLSAPQLLVILSLIGAGLAGTVTALASRDADTAFLYRQQHPLQIRASDVERVVRTAPEPVAGGRTPGHRARCHPEGQSGLRNPWLCSVTYRSGRTAGYRIIVRPSGAYSGHHVGGSGTVTGCCVNVPGGD